MCQDDFVTDLICYVCGVSIRPCLVVMSGDKVYCPECVYKFAPEHRPDINYGKKDDKGNAERETG